MAKKTNTEETPKTDEQVTQTTEEVQAVTTETPTEETPKTEDKQPTNEEKREADHHILAILKSSQPMSLSTLTRTAELILLTRLRPFVVRRHSTRTLILTN